MLSIVIKSTLRGVLGAGGAGSALARGGVAETAWPALPLMISAAELGAPEVGAAGSLLQDKVSSAAHDSAEMLGNCVIDRGT